MAKTLSSSMGSALTEGIERHRIDGIEVAITDPARTIIDCFRYRAKVDIDVAMKGCTKIIARVVGLVGRRRRD